MTEADAASLIDRLEEISGSIQRAADQQREATAATILAALIQAYDGVFWPDYNGLDAVRNAVRLTDRLRAEMERKP